jgi:CDP-glycerol glycerophosphotransferase
MKFRKKICKAIQDGNLIGKTWKEMYVWWMRKVAIVMQRHWEKTIPVEPDTVLFLTFQRTYTCNPKYICEEIIRRKLPWKLIWVQNKFISASFPPEVDVVKEYSLQYFHALYSAGILVDNWFTTTKVAFQKRESQFYVETMHGSLGIKRIDPNAVPAQKRNKRGWQCGDSTNVCISNSTFENNVYRTAFWEDTEIWMMGHARNDILFEADPKKIDVVRQKVYRELSIPPNVRLVLYAPTHRSYTVSKKLDAGQLLSYLESTTGEEWRLLERAHMKSNEEYVINKEKVINAFDYNDIQELMLVTDIGITDYSSWIFDYMLTGKPGFIFAPDLERYTDARGFYYPIETTPFPIAEDTDALIEKMRSFDEPLYRKNVDAFLKEKGCMDDGHAAERIVDALENIIAARQEANL